MSKNEIEAATAYKFLFISEFIISYFYGLCNRFGFSLLPPTQFSRADRFGQLSLYIKQRSCLCMTQYLRCREPLDIPYLSNRPPRVRFVLR